LLLDELGIADHWKGPALTLGQTAEVISMVILPWLLRRSGLRRVLILGASAWALVLAVQALGHPTAPVVSCLALNGLYITCFVIAGQMFVNSRSGPEVRASAQALISFTSGVGLLGGYALSGLVAYQVGGAFRPTFTVASTIAFVAVAGFAIWFHPEVT